MKSYIICDFIEAALATQIFDEVLVGCLPVCLVGCLVHTLLEVVLAFGAVEETALGSAAWLVQELLIDDGLCATALDKLCLLHVGTAMLRHGQGIGMTMASATWAIWSSGARLLIPHCKNTGGGNG